MQCLRCEGKGDVRVLPFELKIICPDCEGTGLNEYKHKLRRAEKAVDEAWERNNQKIKGEE